MAIVEEQPTDKVYMWMVFLTTLAFAAVITFSLLASLEYTGEGETTYKVQKVDPFSE
jgi:hypothetical protein